MPTDYTDQDTERARQAERSSAGMRTQQLQMPSGAPAIAMPSQSRSSLPGALLIGLGVLLLLGRMVTIPLELEGGMVLLTIASCFLFFGLWKRIYGLIIPGSILAGLSVGVTFADLTNGVSVLWGLALGFLGIFALGQMLFHIRSQWAIYPAVPLFAVGVIIAVANLPAFLGAGLIWLPLLLIGAGLYLGWIKK